MATKKRKFRHTKYLDSIVHVTLCEVLIEFREKAAMKQVEVSAGLGRPPAYCNRVERRERVPNPMELILYCHVIRSTAAAVMAEVERRLLLKGAKLL